MIKALMLILAYSAFLNMLECMRNEIAQETKGIAYNSHFYVSDGCHHPSRHMDNPYAIR